MTDLQVIEKILKTLTISFEYIVAAIKESKDLTTMSLDGLIGSLMAYEQIMIEKTESKCEEALQSQVNLKKEVETKEVETKEVETTTNESESSKKW